MFTELWTGWESNALERMERDKGTKVIIGRTNEGNGEIIREKERRYK
jgi:hypothetical protein